MIAVIIVILLVVLGVAGYIILGNEGKVVTANERAKQRGHDELDGYTYFRIGGRDTGGIPSKMDSDDIHDYVTDDGYNTTSNMVEFDWTGSRLDDLTICKDTCDNIDECNAFWYVPASTSRRKNKCVLHGPDFAGFDEYKAPEGQYLSTYHAYEKQT